MPQRRLTWNVLSEEGEDPPKQTWTFAVINKPGEIEKIKQRIKERLAPTEGLSSVVDGIIPKSGGLHYHGITVDSYKRMTPSDFNPTGIYNGKTRGSVRRDEQLGQHKRPGSLEDYIRRTSLSS